MQTIFSTKKLGYYSGLPIEGVLGNWRNFEGVMRQTIGGLMINNLSGDNWLLDRSDTVLGRYPLKPSHRHLLLRQITGNKAVAVEQKTKEIEEYIQWMQSQGLVPQDFVVLTPQDCGVSSLPEVYWKAAYYPKDFRRIVSCKTGYDPQRVIWYLPPPVTLPRAERLLELGDKGKFREVVANYCPQWAIPTIRCNVGLNDEMVEQVIDRAFQLGGVSYEEGSISAVVIQIPTLDGGMGTLVIACRIENGHKVFYREEEQQLLRFESLEKLSGSIVTTLIRDFKAREVKEFTVIASPFLGDVKITQKGIQLTIRSGSFGMYFHKPKGGELRCYITPVRYQVLEGLSYRGFVLDTTSSNLTFSRAELEEITNVQNQLPMILGKLLEELNPGDCVQANVDFIVNEEGNVFLCELNPRSSAVQGALSMMYYVISSASQRQNKIRNYTNGKSSFTLFADVGEQFCMYQYDHFIPKVKTESGQRASLNQISDYIKHHLSSLGIPVVPFNPREVERHYGKNVIYYQFMTPLSSEPPYKLAVLFVIPPEHLKYVRHFVEASG